MKPLEIKHRVIGRGEPLICVPVVEQDAQSVIREITYLSQSTADMIEWRVDAFRDFTDYNAIRSVFEAVAPLLGEKLFLYTFRTAHQGGMAQVKAEQLDDLHDLAAESGCVDLVDLEFFEEDRPLHKIKRLREMGVSVIASHHDFEQTPSPEVMKMLLEKMCAGGADIVKLAVMPQNYKDVLNLLDVTAQFREENPDTPVITMSMGSLGGISRISGETFGSCVTFGAHEKPSAPGQFAMKELRQMLDTIHASQPDTIELLKKDKHRRLLDAAISLCYYNVPNYVTVLIINKVVKYGRIVCGFISGVNRFGKLRIGELFSDMTKSDGMMLWAISQLNQEKNNGRATVSELAEKLHTQNSAVSRTLKNLEDHGWICRMTDPKDRRNTCVALTESGEDMQQNMTCTMQEFGRAVISQMDEQDLKKLIVCLDELYDIAAEEIEKRSMRNRKEGQHGKDF